jgi:hypothetical protein
MATQLKIKLELNNDLFKSYFAAGYSLDHEMTCIEGINHGSYNLRELLRQQLEMEMR